MKAYKQEHDYTYTSGAYATIEMLLARPEIIKKVYIHSKFIDKCGLIQLCKDLNVEYEHNDGAFKRVNQKENSYVLGMFHKYPSKLSKDAPHVVLVNPADTGNLGTIIRTLVGFGVNNLAIITPAVDIWNPKVLRASMGAYFKMKIEQFASFEEYRIRFSKHSLYPFMLDAELELTIENCPKTGDLYSLIFGNEATGLPADFKHIGTSVKLSQSSNVDSLNLSVAVGVGVFIFSQSLKIEWG